MENRRVGGVAGKVNKMSAMAKRRARQISQLESQRDRAVEENDIMRIKELDDKIRQLKAGRGASARYSGRLRDRMRTSGRTRRRTPGEIVKVVEVPVIGGAVSRKAKLPPMPDLTVDMYLDTDDAVTVAKVIKATQRIANELGYETPRITEVERGSFFARFLAAWKGTKGQKARAFSVEKGKELAQELEQYGRLHIQDKQADVDQKNVSSAVELITATADIPRAAIKTGAVLFLKYPGPDGQPVIISRTLSTREMAIYEKTPTLGQDPSKLEENLAILLAQEDDGDDQLAIGQ